MGDQAPTESEEAKAQPEEKEEVKNEEVKNEEVKNEEVKNEGGAEEVKKEEVKTEGGAEEVKKEGGTEEVTKEGGTEEVTKDGEGQPTGEEKKTSMLTFGSSDTTFKGYGGPMGESEMGEMEYLTYAIIEYEQVGEGAEVEEEEAAVEEAELPVDQEVIEVVVEGEEELFIYQGEEAFEEIEEVEEETAYSSEPEIKMTDSEIMQEKQERQLIDDEFKKIMEVGRRSIHDEFLKRKEEIDEVKPCFVEQPVKEILPPRIQMDEESITELLAKPLIDREQIIENVMASVHEGLRASALDLYKIKDPTAIKRIRRVVELFYDMYKVQQLDPKLFVIDKLGDLDQRTQTIITNSLKRRIGRRDILKEEEEEEELDEEELERRRQEFLRALQAELDALEQKLKQVEHDEGSSRLTLADRLNIPEDGVDDWIKGRLSDEDREHLDRVSRLEEKPRYEFTDWLRYLTPDEAMRPLDLGFQAEMKDYLKIMQVKYQLLIDKETKQRRFEDMLLSEEPMMKLKNVNLTVVCKFIINTGDIFTFCYRYFMTFREVKEDLAGIFRVPPDVMLIYNMQKQEICDHQIVKDLGVMPYESVTLRLQTLDSDKFPLESWHLEMPIPDIITVVVEAGRDHCDYPEYKEVVVEVIDRRIRKPFIGGYRDPKTGREYHHAFTQSQPHPPYLPVERRNHRDTQTKFIKRRLMDTLCNKSTQMWRRDCFITTESDVIKTAKPYIDYEEWSRIRDLEGKVRIIQRYLRAYILRKFIKKMSMEYRMRKSWEEEQERKRLQEREDKIKNDLINMTFPRTKAHFDMLYDMVERWRKAQVEKISKLKAEAPKRAEFSALLEKEVKLLESIETHRINVMNERRRMKDLKFMEKVSKPIKWHGYRGMTITMDTIKTQRARELKELYQSLQRDDLTYEKRIEILMAIKYALKIHNTKLTHEIQDLLNRECDLLVRGVSTKKLDFLRRRIQSLFVEFFREVEFNPEVAKYRPDYNKEELRNDVVKCSMCHAIKTKKHFCIDSRKVDVKACSNCNWTYNISVPRINYAPYRKILRHVRRDEQKRSCYSSTAFILQDEDIYFLINNIWHSKSAISGNDNILDLRLPRWNIDLDWTPWNCILITDVEARTHLRLENLDNYEDSFKQTIKTKHLLARNQFKQLRITDIRLRDSGVWNHVQDRTDYKAPPLEADLINYDGPDDPFNYKKKQKLIREKLEPEKEPELTGKPFKCRRLYDLKVKVEPPKNK